MPSSPKTNPDSLNNISAEEIVELGVAIEEVGQKMYLDVAHATTKPDLKKLFLTLAEDEKKHIDTFREILGGTNKSKPFSAKARSEIKQLLESNAFINMEKVKAMLLDAEEHGTITTLAIRFEKETLLLLNGLRDLIHPESLPILQNLIKEETQHIEKLSAYLDKVREKGD